MSTEYFFPPPYQKLWHSWPHDFWTLKSYYAIYCRRVPPTKFLLLRRYVGITSVGIQFRRYWQSPYSEIPNRQLSHILWSYLMAWYIFLHYMCSNLSAILYRRGGGRGSDCVIPKILALSPIFSIGVRELPSKFLKIFLSIFSQVKLNRLEKKTNLQWSLSNSTSPPNK